VGEGLYRDGNGNPIHHWCRLLQTRANATGEALKATCTPPRTRRQYARRVRR
jgi:hypothetical protein